MNSKKHTCVESYLKEHIAEAKYLTVVMNGQINTHQGNEIDNSPVVFRFNLFEIENHEKYVGSKTSYWMVNGDTSIAQHQNRIALCPFPEKKYKSTMREAFKQLCSILYTANDYQQYKLKEITFPTTGYTCLLMLLKLFDVPIHVFGMDGMISGHYWNKHHTHAGKHSGQLEFQHLKTFERIRL